MALQDQVFQEIIMIKVLNDFAEIDESRNKLEKEQLSFLNPKSIKNWIFLYNLRYRWKSDPPLCDHVKSWDVWNAFDIIREHAPDLNGPILDSGCFNSEILYVLNKYGYKKLHGCDLNPHCQWMPFWNQIKYDVCDIMETIYPDNYFQAVTSVSVIEHGVDTNKFFAEMKRILRPGGILIFTTDYDQNGDDHNISEDFRVFGQPWKIFDEKGLKNLVERYTDYGFELLDSNKVKFDHNQRPINWNNEDYTFGLVALKLNK